MNGSLHFIHLVGKIVCTEYEKETVWEIILKLVDLICTVRKEGFLCLDDTADSEKDIFLRSCLRYITEVAPSTEELREYVSIWLATADVSPIRRLEMAVIGDGLEQVLLQRTPSAALRRLGAWLGEEFADRVEKKIGAMNYMQRKERTESLEPEIDQLLTFSDEQLCAVIEQIEDDLLTLALMGASDAVVKRVRSVISAQRCERLNNRMSVLMYPRVCDVREAQRKLLRNILD